MRELNSELVLANSRMSGTQLPLEGLNLDPVLVQLGLLIGLLERTGPDAFALNVEWFERPWQYISSIPTERAPEIASLLEALLGSAAGNALGPPRQEGNRLWYAIPLPSSGEGATPLPLYVVIESDGDDRIFGVGALHELDFAVTDGEARISVTPSLYAPLLLLPPGEDGPFVLGSDAHPIELGVLLNGADGAFRSGGVSFDGISLGTKFFVEKKPEVDVVLRNLVLPGRAGADMSFAAVREVPPSEWVATGLSLLMGQVARIAGGDADRINAMTSDLLDLAGLTGKLPAIDWAGLEQDPGKVFTDWLRTLVATPSNAETWLETLGRLLAASAQDFDELSVTGSGTRADPWTLVLPKFSEAVEEVALTLGVEKGADGALHAYPGLRVGTKLIAPLASVPSLGVQLAIAVELLDVPLSALSSVPSAELGDRLFPTLNAAAVVRNPAGGYLFSVADSPSGVIGGEPTDDGAKFALGALSMGLSYTELDGARKIAPTFELVNIVTAVGSWDRVDLTNFDDVVNAVSSALTELVKKAIEAFFGPDAAALAGDVEAALGLAAPAGHTAEDWPVALLLSASELPALVDDPMGALGAYYARCLRTDVGDVKAFVALLPSVAGILGASGTLPTVSGAGTATDPWRATLVSLGADAPSVDLLAWRPGDVQTALELGLAFRIPLPVTAVAASLSIRTDLLGLTLPDEAGAGPSAARWLSGVDARLTIAGADGKPLSTPSLGGLALSIDRAVAPIGWSRAEGFAAEATLANLTITATGLAPVPVGDLTFSTHGSAWDPKQLATVAQVAMDVAGLWLLGHGGRAGVVLTAGLGLLPKMEEVIDGQPHDYPVPGDLALPTGWPKLAISDPATFFTDPAPAVRAQLRAVFASSDTAEPMMRMIAWAVTGALPVPPSPVPKGTFGDPFRIVLPAVWNLQVLAWTADGGATLGLSLGRDMSADVGAHVAARVHARLDLVTLSLGAGALRDGVPPLPRIAVDLSLANPDAEKSLIDLSLLATQVGRVAVGGYADATGVWPSLILYHASLPTAPTPTDYVLSRQGAGPVFGTDQGLVALEALLFATLGELAAWRGESALLDDALALLLDLGLYQLGVGDGDEAETDATGLNAGGWIALLANPSALFRQQTESLLEDPAARRRFLDAVARLLGYSSFAPPKQLAALPVALSAVRLTRPVPGGYAIVLSRWMTFAKGPIDYLHDEVAALFADPTRVAALITAFTELVRGNQIAPPADGDQVTVTVTDDAVVTIAIGAANPLTIGPELDAYGTIELDLHGPTFSVAAVVGSSVFGAGLGLTLDVGVDAAKAPTFDWGLAIQGFFPDRPASFAPLRIYPLPADTGPYLQRVGSELPLFVLSAITTQVLNDFVLPGHPFAGRLFQALGVASADAEGESVTVRSLLGLLLHPVDWMLSPRVVGNGKGGIDLGRLGETLSKLPGDGVVGPNGIRLVSETHGMKLEGLPFGGVLGVTSDTAAGVVLAIDVVPSGLGAVDLALGAQLAFGLGTGPHIGGTAKLGYDFGKGTSLAIQAGYAHEEFTLSFVPTLSGSSLGTITLLPFGGLNQFFGGGQEVPGAALLLFLGNKAVDAWKTYLAGTPNPELVTLVDGTKAFAAVFGVANPASLLAAVDAIEKDPTAWLLQWVSSAKVEATLTELQKLLGSTLHIPNLAVADRQLTFTVARSESIGALVLALGYAEVGGNDIFGVWIRPTVRQRWFVGTLDAGAGFVPEGAEAGKIEFELAASAGVDLKAYPLPALAQGPTLRFELAASTSGVEGLELFLYPAGFGDGAGTLVIELAPNLVLAQGDAPTTPVDTTEWLFDLLAKVIGPVVGDLILSTPQAADFLSAPIGTSSVVPGTILVDFGLLALAGDPPKYELVDLESLKGKSPQDFLLAGLTAFVGSQGEVPIFSFGKGGIWIVGDAGTGFTDFGLRLQLQDLQVLGETSESAVSSTSKDLLIQLGKWETGDTDEDPWIKRADPEWNVQKPGIAVFFIRNTDGNVDFHARVALISVGVDFKGPDDKALVAYEGFELGGIEPRLYLDIEATDPKSAVFGGSVRLDGVGLPLGPTLSSSSGSENPVAQSLVAKQSGSDDGASGDRDAVNPTFGVSASYVKRLDVQLFGNPDAPGEATGKVWFQIQRALGPLYCEKLGMGWDGPDATPPDIMSVLFDGSVSLAGLQATVVDLSVGIPVRTPTDFTSYRLGLRGLDVSFKGGPVEVAGAFLKTDDVPPAYNGAALVKGPTFGASAIGSYAVFGESPSLFVFAQLNAPLGGPPYFFVTGLAGGFGFNRGLVIPPLEELGEFPLVIGATKPDEFGDGAIEKVLAKLGDAVPIQLGQYWVAAGLKWTTFELLDTFALLTVQFGKQLEIALLGLSTLQLPKAGTPTPPYAYVELAIEVIVDITHGLFSASAVLTPSSYVIAKECRLTGGFALNVWFPPLDTSVESHVGDFVLTVGGYHPLFEKPAWYPSVERVGFNWPVGGGVSIKGGAYFALTPSAVMAGGNLDASYESGNLRAWFDAYADFLLQWNPFHYDIQVGVSVGASYTVHFIVTETFSVELGASVHVWGPPLEGEVRIKWWVISFTVHFGASNVPKTPKVISWEEFEKYFLPQPDASSRARAERFANVLKRGTVESQDHNICRTVVASGTRPTATQETAKTDGPAVVLASQLSLQAQSAIPFTNITFKSAKPVGSITGAEIGVRPMGSLTLHSDLEVEVASLVQGEAPLDLNGWTREPSLRDVPEALWDLVNDGHVSPSAKLLPKRLVALTLTPKARPIDGPPAFERSEVAYADLDDRPLPFGSASRTGLRRYAPRETPPLQVVEQTIMEPAVTALRAEVAAVISDLGVDVTDGRLDLVAAYAETTFQGEPMLGPLGSPGDRVPPRVALTPPFVLDRSSRALVPAPAHDARIHVCAAYRRNPRMAGRTLGSRARAYLGGAFSTPGEAAALRGLARSAGEGAEGTVGPGAVTLFDLGDRGGHRLSHDGACSLDLVALDAAWRLCAHVQTHEGVAGTVRLPDGARYVAVVGPAPAPLTGWDAGTALLVLAPNALLGERCLVRAQAPMPVRGPARTTNQGVTSGERLFAENTVGNDLAPGWIETGFFDAPELVEVVVEGPDGCRDAGVTLSVVEPGADESGQARRRERVLSPSHEILGGAWRRLRFEMASAAGELLVRARPTPGWRVTAMYGADCASALDRSSTERSPASRNPCHFTLT